MGDDRRELYIEMGKELTPENVIKNDGERKYLGKDKQADRFHY